MKKLILIFFVALLAHHASFGRHIKGGWVQYEYKGAGATAGTSSYKVTVYVFRDCVQNGPFPTVLRFYDAASYVQKLEVTGTAYSLSSSISKTTADPCLSNPTFPCYQIYTYSTTVTLQDNTSGYMVVAQDANRVTGIVNIANSISTGISFIGNIPGVINGADYHVNSSPYFNFTDTVIICYNAKFTYQFKATDADSDVLTYSFGNGINGTQTATAPPYSSLTYVSPFSGANPLGSGVTIDSLTGLISGTAPSTTGEYVIAVYVHEWRNGVMINSTKKELQITVGNCSLSAASLKNSYINCNSFQQSFQNESTASNITSYAWDFGVTGSTKDTSTNATPTYTYADTGTYTVKLTVSNSGGCRDSATAPVKIYPGFTPSFTVAGRCFQSPVQFSDNSFVKYGTLTSRLWDFGDSTTLADTSLIANPSYKYAFPGNMLVSMSITSSLGCSGSLSKAVVVNDKPYIYLPFTDTLICSVDTLPLKATATGTFKWVPIIVSRIPLFLIHRYIPKTRQCTRSR